MQYISFKEIVYIGIQILYVVWAYRAEWMRTKVRFLRHTVAGVEKLSDHGTMDPRKFLSTQKIFPQERKKL